MVCQNKGSLVTKLRTGVTMIFIAVAIITLQILGLPDFLVWDFQIFIHGSLDFQYFFLSASPDFKYIFN